jgi:hypothetical protein
VIPRSRTLVPMQPQTAYRLALIMIPLSIAVAIGAAVIGNWFVVAIMVLNLAGQTANLRASRRRLRR